MPQAPQVTWKHSSGTLRPPWPGFGSGLPNHEIVFGSVLIIECCGIYKFAALTAHHIGIADCPQPARARR